MEDDETGDELGYWSWMMKHALVFERQVSYFGRKAELGMQKRGVELVRLRFGSMYAVGIMTI
jgi:hypothetical protein